ncbi:MAG: hypothetical protein ACK4GN_13430 [Runella sp.]
MKNLLLFAIAVFSCSTLSCSDAWHDDDSPRDIARRIYRKSIYFVNQRDTASLAELLYPGKNILTGDSLSPVQMALLNVEIVELLDSLGEDLQMKVTLQATDYQKVSVLVEHEGLKYVGINALKQTTFQLANDTPAGRSAFERFKKAQIEVHQSMEDILRQTYQVPTHVAIWEEDNTKLAFSVMSPENVYVVFDPIFNNWRLAKPTIEFPSTKVALKAWGGK